MALTGDPSLWNRRVGAVTGHLHDHVCFLLLIVSSLDASSPCASAPLAAMMCRLLVVGVRRLVTLLEMNFESALAQLHLTSHAGLLVLGLLGVLCPNQVRTMRRRRGHHGLGGSLPLSI